MPVIETQLNPRSEAFKDSARAMQALVADLEAQLAQIALGGGDAPRVERRPTRFHFQKLFMRHGRNSR